MLNCERLVDSLNGVEIVVYLSERKKKIAEISYIFKVQFPKTSKLFTCREKVILRKYG